MLGKAEIKINDIKVIFSTSILQTYLSSSQLRYNKDYISSYLIAVLSTNVNGKNICIWNHHKNYCNEELNSSSSFHPSQRNADLSVFLIMKAETQNW